MTRREKPKPEVIADMPDDEYERYSGQWVAAKDGHALFGSPNGEEVFDWLDEHHVDGAMVVKLPPKGRPRMFMSRGDQTAAI